MKKYILLVLLPFLALKLLAAPPAEEGRSIFTARCAGCHHVNKVLTGPALAGVEQRRSVDWIVRFVHSSQSMIEKGDEEAIALYQQFNQIPMPDHRDLSSENIKSIIAYIQKEAKPVATEEAPFRRPGRLKPAYRPPTADQWGYLVAYLGAVALLIVGLLVLVQVKTLQRRREAAEG
jgi:mono/diheme cytochrome c family protein